MGFKTDGSSHHEGISNEKSIVDFINTRSTTIRDVICPTGHRAVHAGGTKRRDDVVIMDSNSNQTTTISVKNHKNGGTFDFKNATKVPRAIGWFSSLDADLRNFKIKCGPVKTEAEAEACRDEFNKVFSKTLRTFEHDDEKIRLVLDDAISNQSEYTIINDVKNQEYVLLRTPRPSHFQGWEYFLKINESEEVTSAGIWRRCPHGKEVNTHIRLRCVSNNGVRAFFGVGERSNKSASPCIKTQNDGVEEYIAAHTLVRETWT
jgi:hypothetical protein